MESPAATETAAPRDSELPSGPSPALPKKVVSFGGVEGAGTLAATGGGAAAAGSSSKQPPSAGGATASPLYTNELFSPGPQRQDSWTIEAHAGMEGAGSAAPSGPVSLGGASPLASTPGYTPASSGWLESARKVRPPTTRVRRSKRPCLLPTQFCFGKLAQLGSPPPSTAAGGRPAGAS